MNVEKLADELIALQCGTHSLGLVYDFLLKTYGDPKPARGDFVRFLSGELPAWTSRRSGTVGLGGTGVFRAFYPAGNVTKPPSSSAARS
jgi:hypothetical protein